MNVISLLGKKFTVYLAAVLASYLLASVVATQHVANSLVSMGIGLGARDRLSMVFSDLLGEGVGPDAVVVWCGLVLDMAEVFAVEVWPVPAPLPDPPDE